jgi:translation initiation factor 3 subunit C
MLGKVESKVLYTKIMFELIRTDFNSIVLNPNIPYLSIEVWKKIYGEILHLIYILENNKEIKIIETQTIEEEGKNENKDVIVGSLVSLLEKLDNEFIKNLQYIDPHTQEYVERLIDIRIITELCEKIFIYYKKNNNLEKATIPAIRLFNHLYYLKNNGKYKK